MVRRNPSAIVFDYGDVVGINPTPFILKSIAYEFGIGYDILKEEVSRLIPKSQVDSISENVFWSKLSRDLQIRDSDKLRKVWMDAYEKNRRLNKEMIYFIKKLRNSGYRVYLLTNIANIYRNTLSIKETEKEFSDVIHSYNVMSRKPERRIYEALIEKLDVTPMKCIIIDDEEVNLAIPREMGMKTILFKSIEKLEVELSNIL